MIVVGSLLADVVFVLIFHAKPNAFCMREGELVWSCDYQSECFTVQWEYTRNSLRKFLFVGSGSTMKA